MLPTFQVKIYHQMFKCTGLSYMFKENAENPFVGQNCCARCVPVVWIVIICYVTECIIKLNYFNYSLYFF